MSGDEIDRKKERRRKRSRNKRGAVITYHSCFSCGEDADTINGTDGVTTIKALWRQINKQTKTTQWSSLSIYKKCTSHTTHTHTHTTETIRFTHMLSYLSLSVTVVRGRCSSRVSPERTTLPLSTFCKKGIIEMALIQLHRFPLSPALSPLFSIYVVKPSPSIPVYVMLHSASSLWYNIP